MKEAVLDPGLPGPRQGRVGGQATQHDRRVLERLALQQPGQQEVPLLPQAELVVLVHAPVGRQQPPGLQLDEDRRDEQEFGGHLQVARVQALQLRQVGVHDGRQGDLVELNLLLHDEVEEQVEGPLVDGGGDGDAHRRDPRESRVASGACLVPLWPSRPASEAPRQYPDRL